MLAEKRIRYCLWLAGLAWFLGSVSTIPGQQINWQPNLDAARALAQSENKLIQLHFHADWCRPCRQVDTYVFSDPAVARSMNEKTVPLKIDVDLHPELTKEYNVQGIPADVFITPGGRLVSHQSSPKSSENYLRMLGDVARLDATDSQSNTQMAAQLTEMQNAFQAKQKATGTFELEPFDQQRPRAMPTPKEQLAKESGDAKKAVIANPFANSASSDPPSNDFSPTHLATKKPAAESMRTSMSPDSDFAPGEPQRETPSATNSLAANSLSTPPARSAAKIIANQFARDNSADFEPMRPAKPAVAEAAPITPITPAEAASSSSFEARSLTPRSQDLHSTASSSTAAPTTPPEHAASATPPVALDGDCPVTLLQEGRWAAGDPQFGCIHRGKTYLFASRENQQTFLSDPDRFSPLLAGYDPVSFHDQGELINGDRKFGVFMTQNGEQAIVLFHSAESQARFKSEPEKYLKSIRVATQQVDNQLRR